MSRYSEKRRRRYAAAPPDATEPEDAYSVLPDRAVRLYFRARAGLYGMTGQSWRSLRIRLAPQKYAMLCRGRVVRLSLPIDDGTARPLGELSRDVAARRRCNMQVYSVSFGGRMHVKILSARESPAALPLLIVDVFAFVSHGRPLSRRWLAESSTVRAI